MYARHFQKLADRPKFSLTYLCSDMQTWNFSFTLIGQIFLVHILPPKIEGITSDFVNLIVCPKKENLNFTLVHPNLLFRVSVCP